MTDNPARLSLLCKPAVDDAAQMERCGYRLIGIWGSKRNNFRLLFVWSNKIPSERNAQWNQIELQTRGYLQIMSYGKCLEHACVIRICDEDSGCSLRTLNIGITGQNKQVIKFL